MKIHLKKSVRSTALVALVYLLICPFSQAFGQSSMQGFSGGGGNPVPSGNPGISSSDKIIPAPKTSGKWQLKYNDPGINVTLQNWNCRSDSLWNVLKGPINGFEAVWGKYGKSAKAAKGAKDHFDTYLKTIDRDVEDGMRKSPIEGIFSPPFGKTETKTIPYCYTDTEVAQFKAYIKGMFQHLGSHSDPNGEIKKLFP